MRVNVDRKSDALYFRFDQSQIVESEEVRPGSTATSTSLSRWGRPSP